MNGSDTFHGLAVVLERGFPGDFSREKLHLNPVSGEFRRGWWGMELLSTIILVVKKFGTVCLPQRIGANGVNQLEWILHVVLVFLVAVGGIFGRAAAA